MRSGSGTGESGAAATSIEAVVIGASAGAVTALSELLPMLRSDYPLPVFVVVHVPPDRDNALVSHMRDACKVLVKEAEDKEPIVGGTVYLAPPDYHLLIEPSREIALSGEDPNCFSRPSINVLFESAADVYGSSLLGIVLTGANDDGAQGLLEIHRAGGVAVVEAPSEAECAVMPAAALRACPDAQAMTLKQIASLLQHLGK